MKREGRTTLVCDLCNLREVELGPHDTIPGEWLHVDGVTACPECLEKQAEQAIRGMHRRIEKGEFP